MRAVMWILAVTMLTACPRKTNEEPVKRVADVGVEDTEPEPVPAIEVTPEQEEPAPE